MADVTFAQIEAAIVTRLEAQMDYLAKCASYAGEIEQANDGLPIEAPACFVLFDGYTRDSDASDTRQHIGTVDFSVLVAGNSYTGGTDNRTAEHGAYAIIQDVITALDDHALGLTGFFGLTLSRIERLRVDKLRAMYVVRFTGTLVVSR